MVYGKRGRETRDPGPPRGAARGRSRPPMKPLCSALALALCGCAAAGGWSKPGADANATASAYQDCRDTAAQAVKPEIGINQDILATRGSDWQRAGIGRVEGDTMRQQTRDRAGAIVASCMRAKGFAPAP